MCVFYMPLYWYCVCTNVCIQWNSNENSINFGILSSVCCSCVCVFVSRFIYDQLHLHNDDWFSIGIPFTHTMCMNWAESNSTETTRRGPCLYICYCPFCWTQFSVVSLCFSKAIDRVFFQFNSISFHPSNCVWIRIVCFLCWCYRRFLHLAIGCL